MEEMKMGNRRNRKNTNEMKMGRIRIIIAQICPFDGAQCGHYIDITREQTDSEGQIETQSFNNQIVK